MLWVWFVAAAAFLFSAVVTFAVSHFFGKYLMTWDFDIAQGVGEIIYQFALPFALFNSAYVVYSARLDIPSPAAVWRVWRS